MDANQLMLAVFLICVRTSKGQDLHPFLYFSGSDVDSLKQQSKTTHREIFARIRNAAAAIKKVPLNYIPPRDWFEFSSSWNEKYGNNLAVLAMYCVLENRDVEARGIAIRIIDAFISLPNWRVRKMWSDNVPVAHSLVGLATAFDFLYQYLDSKRRVQILANLTAVSREIYDEEKVRINRYIHNHVPTVCVALLTSALIVDKHSNVKEASEWKEKANEILNRTMFLLNQVNDGSMNEGVAYGSYTTRSLTQYIVLAKRHLGIDLTNNSWLHQHFWFMYRTILPGFRDTVGIADSNFNWMYGPESQLVFLDKFVMRNGYGNWLAGKIRRLNHDPSMATTPRYCTLHTEFLFYDASIPAKEPPNAYTPHLHIFSDWGVVTYGGGTLDMKGQRSTFLSFKSSVLHGKAVNQIVRKKSYSWIKGRWHFNPGHEHPDQGSFVFAPYGVPFVTEAYYGPKYTWLNNVLLFGPTSEPSCSAPYKGQLGECEKWLRHENEEIWLANAEIVAAFDSGGMTLMSGEFSKWYSPSLGLTSVYRVVILLHPGVLLVVDHVGKSPKSRSRYVGAFFHNRDAAFSLKHAQHGQEFSEIVLHGQTYTVLWSKSYGQQSIARSHSAEYPAEYGTRKTHYLNITTNLRATQTRFAYVFIAPGIDVTPPHLNDQNEGLQVSLRVNNVRHLVSITTNYKTPQERKRFLGFDGFAKVQVGARREILFPLQDNGVLKTSKHAHTLHLSTFNILTLFVWVSGLLVLFFTCKRNKRRFMALNYFSGLLRVRCNTLVWIALFLLMILLLKKLYASNMLFISSFT